MIFSHIWSDFLRTKALSSPPLGGRYTLVLGERLNGIQEVSGSIPLISTRKHPSKDGCFFLLFPRVCGRFRDTEPPAKVLSRVMRKIGLQTPAE